MLRPRSSDWNSDHSMNLHLSCVRKKKKNNTQYVSCLLFSWALTATLTLAPAEVDDLKEATGSAEFHQFHPQAARVSITDNQGH